jgi:hypothetical protein
MRGPVQKVLSETIKERLEGTTYDPLRSAQIAKAGLSLYVGCHSRGGVRLVEEECILLDRTTLHLLACHRLNRVLTAK